MSSSQSRSETGLDENSIIRLWDRFVLETTSFLCLPFYLQPFSWKDVNHRYVASLRACGDTERIVLTILDVVRRWTVGSEYCPPCSIVWISDLAYIVKVSLVYSKATPS